MRLILRIDTMSFLPLSISRSKNSASTNLRMSKQIPLLVDGTMTYDGHFCSLFHGSNIYGFIVVIYNVTINRIPISYHYHGSCLMNTIISIYLQTIHYHGCCLFSSQLYHLTPLQLAYPGTSFASIQEQYK